MIDLASFLKKFPGWHYQAVFPEPHGFESAATGAKYHELVCFGRYDWSGFSPGIGNTGSRQYNRHKLLLKDTYKDSISRMALKKCKMVVRKLK